MEEGFGLTLECSELLAQLGPSTCCSHPRDCGLVKRFEDEFNGNLDDGFLKFG